MNNVIKKTVVCIAVLLAFGAAHAQKGAMAGGLNFAVAFGDHFSHAGFAPKFQYYLSDRFRGEADLTILLPTNSATGLDLAAYAHYLFGISEKAFVYPIVGVGFYSNVYKSELSSWPTAALGGGIEYALSGRLSINGELKYKGVSGSGTSFGMLTAGLAYKF